ncbi:MAG: hypothetical protein PHP44_14670 [Kiritimatiellae bacterium]|nr:hypothetical protein [Kiritimatiellia bacterium]
MNRAIAWILCSLVSGFTPAVYAQTRDLIVYEKPARPEVLWAITVPETTETFASRYDKEKTRVGQAQAVLERELLDAGFRLIALPPPPSSPQTQDRLLQEALASGADYLISGEASVSRILSSESGSIGGGFAHQNTRGEQSAAWGSINQPENTANIQVRILRVTDGRLMQTESAVSTASVRAKQGGAQGALEDASRRLLRNLIPAMEDILREQQREPRTPSAQPDNNVPPETLRIIHQSS